MGCSEFIAQMDSWMDGEREPAAQAHAARCQSCSSLAADFDAIQIAAPALSVADPEPPARVWAGLRAQLIEEGLIREPAPVRSSASPSWLANLLPRVPRPAVAGAYLGLLIASGFALSVPFSPPAPQATSFPLSSELDNAEQTTVSSFASSKSPVSVALHENLEIVDHYIALCEKSVREEPQNSVAREYLYQAYEQKADLLSMITEHGDSIQ